MKIPRHNYGFFSCCSVRLFHIVKHYNKNQNLPDSVDSSDLYDLYKPEGVSDITFHFFEHYNTLDIDIPYKSQITMDVNNFQFENYRHSPYGPVSPFVQKYFMPSYSIRQKENLLIEKYGIDLDNCVAVYYRGTDKQNETTLGTYETYYQKMLEIRNAYPNTQILLQTDTRLFIEYMVSRFGSDTAPIIMSETGATYGNDGMHYLHTNVYNYFEIQYLFAICLIISRCKHVIMSSGNVSTWIMHYRGHADGINQFLNGEWLN